MSKNQQYQERVQRMVDVANGKIPDRVPVCALIESYALACAGTTIPGTFG